MKRSKRIQSLGVALLVILAGMFSTAQAQTTLFTYQGKLTENGSPASGSYDFQIKLYDTATTGTGTQQGPTLLKTNISVTSGSFSLQLDFGVCASCFNGADRFLELAVKPTGGPSFTTLSPRQQITTTPYAFKSTSSDGLSVACVNCITSSQIQSVQGSQITGTIPAASVPPGSASYIQNTNTQQASSNFNISGNGILAGALGVGTLSPLGKAQFVTTNDTNPGLITSWDARHFVVGNSANSGGVGMSYDQTNQVGYIHSLSPNVAWRSLILQLGGGNVGVGTNSPSDKFEVAGNIRIFPSSGSGSLALRNRTSADFSQVVFLDNTNTFRGFLGYIGAGNTDLGLRADTVEFGSNGKAITFLPNNAEVMRLAINGNVGIGTILPTSGKLQVYGGSGVAVHGTSDNNSGVYGASNTGIGIFGESAQFDGVRGLAHNVNHGAVVGVHDGNGIAMFGTGFVGVVGESTNATGAGGVFRNTAGGKAIKVEGTASIGVIEITGGSDLAEHFEVAGDARPGMVVVIDPARYGKLSLARSSYNRRVAGIVSGANNLSAGMVLPDAAKSKKSMPVALSGRVWVYCDASRHAIRPGDLLTTSNTPGHAMKVIDHTKARGSVIGKAMTGLRTGRGLVLVLVSLQ